MGTDHASLVVNYYTSEIYIFYRYLLHSVGQPPAAGTAPAPEPDPILRSRSSWQAQFQFQLYQRIEQ